jgi:dephospho-CoA kinase
MSHERRGVVAVGLTGGIGAGKSTALAIFKELGALTVSADQLYMISTPQSGSSAIVAARFGTNVLNGQGGGR